MQGELLEAERVGSIVGGFFNVYNYFGYGLSEAVYVGALQYALETRGHVVNREVRVPVYYKEHLCAWQRLDMVVDGKVIVESKAREKLVPAWQAQLITYLRATTFEVGVLLHFGPRPSFHRFIDWPKRRPGQGSVLVDSCRLPVDSADRDADRRSSDVPLIERDIADGGARLGTLGELEHDSAAPRLSPTPDRSGDAHEGVGIDVHDAAHVQADGEDLRA
jgi:GxxExxY protein